MTESTFSGTVTINGTQYQVSADLTATPVVTPPAGGGGGGAGGGTPPPPPAPQCYFGIWDPTEETNGSLSGVQQFNGAPVKSVTWYTQWGYGYPLALANNVKAANQQLYIKLEPWKSINTGATPAIADITRGVYDSWITQIGNAIKAGGVPVYVDFGHEMNGMGWYPWQQSAGVTPAAWQAAYKHVCQVLRAAAGPLVVMVWAANNADTGPLAPYWVGDQYADIIGFDGYLKTGNAAATFGSFCQQTVNQIKALTSNPMIWNAECGIEPGPTRAARITQFVADMKAAGLFGFTWFNEGTMALSAAEINALTTAVNLWNNG